MLDCRGELQSVSPASTRVLGAQFRAGAALCEFVHPADVDALHEALASICWGEREVGMPRFRARAAGGEWIAFEGRLRDAREEVGALVFNARDISKCSQTSEALRQSQAKLANVLDAAPVFVWRCDRAGTFVFARGNAQMLLGYSPQDRIGRNVYEMFSNQPQIIHNFERALGGETFEVIVDFGGTFYDARYTPAYDENGEISGVIGAAMDASSRLAAERVLENSRAQAEFEAAQAEVLDRLARGRVPR